MSSDSPPDTVNPIPTDGPSSTVTSSDNASLSPVSTPPLSPLSWPPDGKLTLDWICNLISVFDWASRNLPPADFPSVLPVSVFDSLVLTASKILHKEPNCVRIDDVDSDSVVVVVGDLHGQLHDALFLLRDAGFPSENRVFVFNGDYVDRGAWGLETFLLLLAWKVLALSSSSFFFPVFLNQFHLIYIWIFSASLHNQLWLQNVLNSYYWLLVNSGLRIVESKGVVVSTGPSSTSSGILKHVKGTIILRTVKVWFRWKYYWGQTT